jgi:Fe-S-cluster containining protein
VKKWEECEGCFGYCCIGSSDHSTTFLTLEDITKIARFLEMPESAFRRDFVIRVGRNGMLALKFGLNPCVFWTQGRCGIYPVRPWFCMQATPTMYSGTIPCKDLNRTRAGV